MTSKEISIAKKYEKYIRDKKLLNSINKASCLLIYIFSALWVISIVIVAVHDIFTNNWGLLIKVVAHISIIGESYFLKYLRGK